MCHREVVQQLVDELKIPTHKIDTSFVMARSTARHAFLREFAQIAIERNLDGACAECGVYRGEFARLINAHFPTKKLYLFDTFESFAPQDMKHEIPNVQKFSQLFANTSVELVLSKMPNPTQCVVRKGWFPDTARGLEGERFCFVSLDMDLHDPILAGLMFFYPRLVRGGAILVDDYFDPSFLGAKEAVDCFAREHHVVFAPIGDSSSIVLVKGT
ncbi:MAG: TylF/MycF family methyltransferase, partial [Helicobacter sp.]|nr:TylF/MycF family methyltransferase [Helicobacter sp.]